MTNQYIFARYRFIPLMALLIWATGCKKLVEVNAPYTSTNSGNVYNTNANSVAALTSIYTNFTYNQSVNSISIIGLSFYGGLSADEFSLWQGSIDVNSLNCYRNSLNAQTAPLDFWSAFYPDIYEANAAIAGLNGSSTLTPAVKQQLLGEAYFVRAFFYFYLTNLYGDVPLIVGTDYTQNAQVTRSTQKDVYTQIIADLKQSQTLLSKNYVGADGVTTATERVRPSYWAATALLARVYLYNNDWSDAASQASTVIQNTSLFSLSSPNNAFLRAGLGNNEAIWQVQPVSTGFNTVDARTFIITSTGLNSNQPVSLSPGLLASFEPNDQRKTNWVGQVTVGGNTYYFPYKYKINTVNNAVTSPTSMTEYEMVLRLGEQYLIRAEAEANNNDASDAVSDLNKIRSRAGLPGYSGPTDQASILAAILHERRVELFSEWGHRWLDLKRTGNVNAVMGTGGACAVKGGVWNLDWALYPIIVHQLQLDPLLVQNPGY